MKNKKIFIEIPTWLGDAIMTTPAIENIVKSFEDCQLIIFGSFVSTRLFLHHPNLEKIIIDNSKNSGNRYLNLRKLAKSVGTVDYAFSFRKNFTTKVLLFFINAKVKFRYKRYTKLQRHQVLRYNDFINKSLSLDTIPNKLKIYQKNVIKKPTQLTLGINPGATYGSAKRWYPKEFAKVAIELSKKYKIIIFGSNNEIQIANDIEKELQKANITNYQNLAGKTTVEELIVHISTLGLFITNDSGPMHIASAFQVPTICIFGPTKDKETSQWQNNISVIIKKDFKCMPCMKRECPLVGEQNHQCMKSITANDVLEAVFANITALSIKKKKLQKDFLKKYNLSKETKIILFKAKNFKQNGIDSFLNIVSNISATNFQVVVSGDEVSMNLAKQKAQKLKIANKILFIEYFSIKTCDILLLPTTNKKFNQNILKAMQSKCVVFVPNTNEASCIVDIFATMQGANDQNTVNKIDALLNNLDFLKKIQKENKLKLKNDI
jgi:heptosyltransferase-2